MNCPTCGSLNEAGRKFCGECGGRLSAACPSCGTPNAPGTKFCGECGTALTDAVAAPVQPSVAPVPSAAPSAERRLVSVLFADLVGSTTLAEDRDPEETRDLLTRYFDTASELIGRYGGTIEKFIGDAVMAVWGVPTAHEDDPERAVRAALDLVSAVGGMTDAGLPLQVRAAVLTGEAAATIGARGQGMVAGDLVNSASRLQGLAPPGTVLVGESTHRATVEAIAYEEVGEQILKGRTSPIPAWRAVQVAGHARWRPPAECARGAVRWPGRRAAAGQGPVPCDRPGVEASAGDDRWPGGHRKVAPGLGVREVHRRGDPHRLLARRALPVIRRRDQLLGPGRDGP